MSITDIVCYACLSESESLVDKDLVRPCTNENCTARIHKECLAQQLKSDIKMCGICQSPIHVNEDTEFNKTNCVIYFLKRICNILILLIGPSVLILLALGKTITNWQSCSGPSNGPCDDWAIGTIFFTVLLWPLFFQFQICDCKYHIFCCASIKQKLKWKSIITMNIMFVISCGLVILAHCIGYPIIKYMFELDEFFTWRTSLAGFVCYSIIVGCGIIIIIIIGICIRLRDYATKKFSEPKFSYGVPMTNEFVQ